MTRVKIVIINLTLTDIPCRQNRLFLKLKAGKDHLTTTKFPISSNNCVKFDEFITFEYNPKCHLRFSFRLEKSDGVKFSRYGVAKVNFNVNLNQKVIKKKLSNCFEKPIMKCEVKPYNHFNLFSTGNNNQNHSISSQSQFHDDSCYFKQNCSTNNTSMGSPACQPDTSKSQSKMSTKVSFSLNEKNSQNITNIKDVKCRSISINSMPVPSFSEVSISNSSNLYVTSNSAPIIKLDFKIPNMLSPERFIELEGKIDDLLAGIINEEFRE
ncbi:hypothetical protein TRFO_32406 [Tritrichomonas foetus]|uniref:Uncharacterized protein n=1 Tax=Tritrichomonas foetus TaxID=1144522 RepID=A0A1J4JP78_9EUKA|nr:hypothetical protein TRFO_32406 [Tritrichomonas foetus]|eukprot:OHT00843.1 hypothetical protein TRFO_32406 [Tritrichomonas foetus]